MGVVCLAQFPNSQKVTGLHCVKFACTLCVGGFSLGTVWFPSAIQKHALRSTSESTFISVCVWPVIACSEHFLCIHPTRAGYIGTIQYEVWEIMDGCKFYSDWTSVGIKPVLLNLLVVERQLYSLIHCVACLQLTPSTRRRWVCVWGHVLYVCVCVMYFLAVTAQTVSGTRMMWHHLWQTDRLK